MGVVAPETHPVETTIPPDPADLSSESKVGVDFICGYFTYLFVFSPVFEFIYWERLTFRLLLLQSQVPSKLCQTCRMKFFAKISNRILR